MAATCPARRAIAARNGVTAAARHATSSAITVPTHVAQHVGTARNAQAQREAEHHERLREHERHHPKSGEPPQRPIERGDARDAERAKHEPAERETAEAERIA